MSEIILTGVTPSGNNLHLGNYFGALKPLVDLGKAGNLVYCFVSDLHALTTVQDKTKLKNNIKEIVLDYLACGVEGDHFVFFRQSQVPQHCQLQTILNNYVSLGQMKRMHAYKDKLEKGASGESINLGLFNYPVLMAADILLYAADKIPVGADQKQHVEIARDICDNFNRAVGKVVLKKPAPLIDEDLGKIVGTDGERKMSKSLGNIIGIFDDDKIIEKQIMSCYTDPSRLKATDPGHIEGNPLFTYHDLINDDKKEVAELKRRYAVGEVGDVEVKEKLIAAHHRYFAPLRERRAYLAANPLVVEQILARGAGLASLTAQKTLAAVMTAVGLEVSFGKQSFTFDKTMAWPLVSIADFAKLELRVGQVIDANNPEWSEKLIEQRVDFGPQIGQKTIYSALRAWYQPADFVGRKLVYVTNLPARKMGEHLSEGMIVAIEGDDRPERWEVSEQVAVGSIVG